MKEIALIGTVNKVEAGILSSLLENNISVNLLTDNPEKVMLADSKLTVTQLDVENYDKVRESLEGYHDLVLAYNDDLQDKYTNDLTLKTFVSTMHAAREAGVARVIVVGSPDSEAFFVNDLRRLDDIDWVFISTEGAFAAKVSEQIINPSFHREIYN